MLRHSFLPLFLFSFTTFSPSKILAMSNAAPPPKASNWQKVMPTLKTAKERVSKLLDLSTKLAENKVAPVLDQATAKTITADNITALLSGNKKNALFTALATTGIIWRNAVPNPTQVKVIQDSLSASSQVIVIEGVPGSGKTSNVLKWLVGIYETQAKANEPVTIIATAPNDGGMNALKNDFKSLGRESLICDFKDLSAQKPVGRTYVIVDECYTMTQTQLIALFELALANKWRVILSGDSQQNIPEVQPIVGIFEGLFPEFLLDESFRASKQKERNFAKNFVNLGLSSALTTLAQDTHMDLDYVERRGVFISYNEQSDYSVVTKWLVKHVRKNDATMIIVAKHLLDTVNKACHDALVNEKIITSPSTFTMKNGAKITLGIDSSVKLNDGRTCIVKNIENNVVTLTLKDTTTLTCSYDKPKEGPVLLYNYAVTSLASQGESIPNVAVLMNKKMTQAEIYVALTRHKSTLTVFIPLNETSTEFFVDINDTLEFQYASDANECKRIIKLLSSASGKTSAKIEENAKTVQKQSAVLGLSDSDSDDEQQELVAEEKSAPLPIDFSPSGF